MEKRRQETHRRHGMQLLTLIISTTMVLTLLGLVVLSVLTARGLSTFMRENVTINVELSDTVSASHGHAMAKQIEALPYAKQVKYIGKDEALRIAINEMGIDSAEFNGFNPLPAELEVQLQADYANSDSLALISVELMKDANVVDVVYTEEQIDGMNQLLNPINMALLVLALLLIFICYTLISNSVQLSVYARRFNIHTMKLVGASWAFIRKPFVKQAVFVGVVSALLTCLLLGGIIAIIHPYLPSIDQILTAGDLVLTGLAVLFFGLTITVICTLLAVNKFLRMTAGELYKI